MELYKQAYQYISASEATKEFVEGLKGVDGSTPINVADSIVFLEASAFAEKISEANDADFAAVLDSLMAADSAATFPGYHAEELESLGAGHDTPLILFFSRPRSNVLLAELFYNSGQEEDYKRVAAMNRGLLFMLKFGAAGSIEESLTTTVEYN